MDFEKKVRFIRTLQQFKVAPIAEVRAIAFAAREKQEAGEDETVIAKLPDSTLMVLGRSDIDKIIREYPDLRTKLK